MAQKILDSLRDRLDAANVALKEFTPPVSSLDAPETVLFEKQQRSKKEIQAIITALKKQIKDISSTSKPLKDRAAKLRSDVEEDIAFEKGSGGRKNMSTAQRSAAIAEATKLERQANDIETKGITAETAPEVAEKLATEPTPTPPTTTATTATPRETTSAAQFRMAEEARPGPAVTGGGTRRPRTPRGAGAAAVSGTNIFLGDIPGVETGVTTGDGGGAAVAPLPEWAKIVQQEFGSLWDVYNSNADVKAVLDKSVQEGWFNDETKLTESLRSTGWFRTTERAARQFAIRQSTDPAQVEDEILTRIEDIRGSAGANALSFDDATYRKLATDSIKYGWSEQQQINAIGSEAVAQAQGRGAQGMADLRSGFVGQTLRKTAAAYAQKPQDSLLDNWVTDIMTGKKTQQQWTDLMRSSAATQFRSLQPSLDKGQDVETAMYAYKQQATRVLGQVMDTTDIDWTDNKWNPALNYRDPKTNEYRQMDLWEWNEYLRGMNEWKQTDEAKNIYGNIAMSLSQAFSTKGTGKAMP